MENCPPALSLTLHTKGPKVLRKDESALYDLFFIDAKQATAAANPQSFAASFIFIRLSFLIKVN